MKICVLKSGSRGNCTVVWSKDGALLLDCGNFPMKYFCAELEEIGLDPEDIKGIIISHGHGDHINQTTLRISSKFNIPIYIHPQTYEIVELRFGNKHPKALIKSHKKKPFFISNLEITPFETEHKGKYVGKPHGFVVKNTEKKKKIGFLTDTSKVTQTMIEHLADSDMLLLEANHDLSIVRKKRPVDKNWREHLNNEAAADAIVSINNASSRKNALKHVFVMHISKRHNDSTSIEKTFKETFKKAKIRHIELILTYQTRATQILNI